MTLTDRFWSKVRKGGGCWEWIAYRHVAGRGMFRVGNAMKYAPRVSWELTNGQIPEGLHVLHHCDNPGCVRPDHLFLGDQDDNMKDMVEKGRANRPIGETNGRCKNQTQTIMEIKDLLNAGYMPAPIRDMGYDYSLVRALREGKTWKHVK